MKSNKLIYRIISFVLMIPAFMLPFIPVFEMFLTTGKNVTSLETYKLYADYSGVSEILEKFQSAWMVINAVLVTILMVEAVAYLVLIILDLCKVSFKGKELVEKVLAMTILIAGILAFIIAIVAISVNGNIKPLFSVYSLKGHFGMWIQVSFIVSGVFALLGLEQKAKKSKK